MQRALSSTLRRDQSIVASVLFERLPKIDPVMASSRLIPGAKGIGTLLPALRRASPFRFYSVDASPPTPDHDIKSSAHDADSGNASNKLPSSRTPKDGVTLFPSLGSTSLFLRDGAGMYNNLFLEHDRAQYVTQLRQKCWNLMGRDSVTGLVEKCIEKYGVKGLTKELEMLIELVLRSKRVPYGGNTYLNEVKKMRSLVSDRTKANTSVESVKVKSIYQSASMIAQDICVQLRNKMSFRVIFNRIVSDIPLVMKHVEGIRVSCSGRIQGAEIARTECAKYGKISRNVFDQKVDYASAEVSTRSGLIGVKVWISYSKRRKAQTDNA